MSAARACTLLSLLTLACNGSYFRVYVRDAERKPIARASVFLYGATDDACDSGPSGGRQSDSTGTAYVHARWCGQARLLVAAEGYLPTSRKLDTCAARAIDIALQPRTHSADAGSNALVATARRFLDAVRQRDKLAVQRLLVDPAEAALYEGLGLENAGQSCKPRFVRVLAGSDPQVEFSFDCEKGCRARWHVHIRRQFDAWRVRALTLATPGYETP